MTEEYSYSPPSQKTLTVLSKLFPSSPHIPRPNRLLPPPSNFCSSADRARNGSRGNNGGIAEIAVEMEEEKREYVSSIIVNNVNQTYNHIISGLDNLADSEFSAEHTHEVEEYDLRTSDLEEGQVLDILSDLTFSDDSKHSTYVIYNQASHSFSLVSQANLSTNASTMITSQASKLQPLPFTKPQIEKSSPIHCPEADSNSSEAFKRKRTYSRKSSLISARFSQHVTRKYCKRCDSEVITIVSLQLKQMSL